MRSMVFVSHEPEYISATRPLMAAKARRYSFEGSDNGVRGPMPCGVVRPTNTSANPKPPMAHSPSLWRVTWDGPER